MRTRKRVQSWCSLFLPVLFVLTNRRKHLAIVYLTVGVMVFIDYDGAQSIAPPRRTRQVGMLAIHHMIEGT